MRAVEALKAARAAGVELALDGEDLVLEAVLAPQAAVLDALSQHKPEIVALLRPGRDGWSGEDWHHFFDERAGIAEFDGGLPRAEAEDAAYHACLMHWQYRNPVSFSSAPLRQCGSCGSCGGPKRAGDILLAIGIAPDQVWLHDGCWSAWHADRVAQAEASLAAIGIHRRTQS